MVIYILNLAFLESRARDLIYCRDQCKIILRHHRRSVISHCGTVGDAGERLISSLRRDVSTEAVYQYQWGAMRRHIIR